MTKLCGFYRFEKGTWLCEQKSTDVPTSIYKIKTYGKIYKSIKEMYSNIYTYVKIDQMKYAWFQSQSGVRQDDNLDLFINDLIVHMKNTNIGIQVHDKIYIFFSVRRWPCPSGCNKKWSAKFALGVVIGIQGGIWFIILQSQKSFISERVVH